MENKKNPLLTLEKWVTIILLVLLAGILLVDLLFKTTKIAIFPGATDYVKHLVLIIAFVGAMITTRDKKHLAMGVGQTLLKGKAAVWASALRNILTLTILTILFFTSFFFCVVGFTPGDHVGVFPVQVFGAVMPIGFLVMILRTFKYMDGSRRDKWLAAIGLLLGIVVVIGSLFNSLYRFIEMVDPENFDLLDKMDSLYFGYADFFAPFIRVMFWPLFALFVVAAFFGTPIFIVLGGIGILLSSYMGNLMSDFSLEGYNILINEKIPAIPLFTLAGFILSESKAGQRLVKLFDTTLGWLPGGLAIVTVVVCAFFTTFTGASGVTILALGGLLSFMLNKEGYSKTYNEGLITGAGSIGLLFPPSVPIIMYGVAALIDIRKLFVAGIIPGLLMVSVLAGMGVVHALRHKLYKPYSRRRVVIKSITARFGKKHAFLMVMNHLGISLLKAGKALLDAAGEILLPIIILVTYFSGFTTLMETGAVAVLYTIILAVFIKRDLTLKELVEPFRKSIPIIGGILIIMFVAKGLSSSMLDIPILFAEWMKAHVSSPYVFLILLNIMLLIVGCVMDIFAAILVIAPLVIELGRVYGIDSIHLGIIFLANLQIGYLTPPVGLNLFLASYRFEAPLARIYKNVIPFFLALLIVVLLITYIPVLSTGLLKVITF